MILYTLWSKSHLVKTEHAGFMSKVYQIIFKDNFCNVIGFLIGFHFWVVIILFIMRVFVNIAVDNAGFI